MMKRSVAALVAAPLLLAPLAAVSSPAQAASKNDPCVTKSEFHKVKRGISIDKSKRIIGGNGKQQSYTPAFPSIGIPASQTREYKTCTSRYGFVWIDFDKTKKGWQVSSKTAYWG